MNGRTPPRRERLCKGFVLEQRAERLTHPGTISVPFGKDARTSPSGQLRHPTVVPKTPATLSPTPRSDEQNDHADLNESTKPVPHFPTES
ncbi:hypothetical protein SALBM311S_02853 [Streptomyces alboniger]